MDHSQLRCGLAPVPGISALQKDVGCSRSLNWRCDLPDDLPPKTFERGLSQTGWVSRCRHPALRVLRNSEDHEIAWVLASGRIQIRVSLCTEVGSREGEARKIHGELVEIIRSLPAVCSDQESAAPAATELSR